MPILLSLLVVLLLLLGPANGFPVDSHRSVSSFAWTKTATTTTPSSSFAWWLPVWRRPSFLLASRPKDQQQHQQEDKEAFQVSPPRRSVWLSLEECLALHQNNKEENVHFVDGSWYHKGHRNGREEFEKGPRIAAANYFDLSVLVDACTPIPLQLPPPALLEAALQDMGILLSLSDIDESDPKEDASTTNTTTTVVVVYGRQGAMFLPRVWFTLDQFLLSSQQKDGCQEVSVYLMQASLEEWIEAGGPVETDFQSVHDDFRIEPVPPLALDDDDYRKNTVVSLDQVQQFLQKPEDCIFVDARGSSFQKGHMPGAIHIPYSSLLRHAAKTTTTALTTTMDSMAFLEPSQLQAVFAQAGVDVHDPRPIICTCGSGISACSLYLGLQECGRRRTAAPTFLYDGSWQEYKRQPDDTCPKVMMGSSSSVRGGETA